MAGPLVPVIAVVLALVNELVAFPVRKTKHKLHLFDLGFGHVSLMG